MDIKAMIEQLREEFAMAHMNNSRVMEIIDTLWKENQELKRLATMKFKDIDDEERVDEAIDEVKTVDEGRLVEDSSITVFVASHCSFVPIT